MWNESLSSKLEEVNYLDITNPATAYNAFMVAIMEAIKPHFKMTKAQHTVKEPGRPWFSLSCKKKVAITRRALKDWLKDPLNTEKRIAWSKAEVN